MKIVAFVFGFLFISIDGIAQPPSIQWQRCLGGTNIDNVSESQTVYHTADGGCIICGHTASNDGDVFGTHGLSDCWVAKLDSNGTLEWSKAYGGSGEDGSSSIVATRDGNFVMAATSPSNDGNVSGNHGISDIWVVKLDSAGNIIWQKCFGGSLGETARSIKECLNGGYIICGYTFTNNDGDVSGGHTNTPPTIRDIWIIKIDIFGNLMWQKCLGGTNDEQPYGIDVTSDNGIIVVGHTQSNDFDVSGLHGGSVDIWVIKLDSLGNIDWQKCLGGSFTDIGHSIIQTREGGYAVIGLTSSRDGDVTDSLGLSEAWVVKLSSLGGIEWQRSYGGSDYETGKSIKQTSDGGFLLGIETMSIDNQVSLNHGWDDYWIVKIDSLGNIEWEKTFGGSSDDIIASIDIGIDSSIYAHGSSGSNDGDVSNNHGNSDLWVVKLRPNGLYIPSEILNTRDILIHSSSKGFLDINFFSNSVQSITINVFNIWGQSVKRYNTKAFVGLNTVKIDGSTITKGIYFVEIIGESRVGIKKFIR